MCLCSCVCVCVFVCVCVYSPSVAMWRWLIQKSCPQIAQRVRCVSVWRHLALPLPLPRPLPLVRALALALPPSLASAFARYSGINWSARRPHRHIRLLARIRPRSSAAVTANRRFVSELNGTTRRRAEHVACGCDGSSSTTSSTTSCGSNCCDGRLMKKKNFTQ